MMMIQGDDNNNNNNNNQKSIPSSLNDLTWEQLRYYARQHIFAGYSRVVNDEPRRLSSFRYCCTRHHCIDWNYVGVPRNRPNKWWIEPKIHHNTNENHNDNDEDDNNNQEPTKSTAPPNVWKEWSYATNPQTGQAYYGERWERLEHGGSSSSSKESLVMALRKRATHTPPDGIIVMVDDHFNYCIDRVVGLDNYGNNNGDDYYYNNGHAASLVDLVDAAVANQDRATAQQWLSMQGGHGRIRRGSRSSTTHIINNNTAVGGNSEFCWMIDCAVEFWKQGTPLWIYGDTVTVQEHLETPPGNELSSPLEQGACTIWWNHEPWEIFETNLQTVQQLKDLLATGRYV